ncbi:Methyltransferase type 11 [Rippkaea orientalis PCC 8801]|uniref:Methyltransferase type 11 n=1 Tax=Rippkaea orientalis (strain PCC 8801 / RF-1) TaxID=41431 RepID=B7K5B4_RIPO1|nr:class I SAM-dependent methyltransferase [Rippkaea orientalis]ACK67940.1 Methyltransferase type 11 [Rippkaea orientalis PCC 8801]
MTQWYGEDLAYIHHQGFSDYALKSVSGILEILHQNQIHEGLIVELGCGSGRLTQGLVNANYQVLGIDISEAMINLARKNVPKAQFQVNSFFQASIPLCHAVISVGECFNYLFDTNNNDSQLYQLFERIYRGLVKGGVFIFDVIEMSYFTADQPNQLFREEKDWIILVEKSKNQEQKILTRRIITLRKVGETYRRNEELHEIRVYNSEDLVKQLEQIGFSVKLSSNYGDFRLPQGNKSIIACKIRDDIR